MIFENIHKDIVSSFSSLWKTKQRGNTLEIITPFATTNQRFPSVFLSERDGEFIISDGGWISEGVYGVIIDRKIGCLNKIFLHYQNELEIKTTKDKAGSIYFYKKAKSDVGVPSIVLDMSTFISSLISASNIDYVDKEADIENTFNRKVKDYLTGNHPNKEWYFNEYLDESKKVRPHAILRKKNSNLVILNYITGSTYDYFRTNISKTNMTFELADESKENKFIENKVALLDDISKGYQIDKISNWLDHMVSKPKSTKIEWTQKEKLQNI